MTSIPNENPLPRPSVPLIERFAPLAVDYDVLFCDVWGVVHNGVAAFADACDALARFRSSGGTAILLTNAPRPAAAVARILDRFGVPRAAYDAIVTCRSLTALM
jgi:ribonucleotide monophosphatase NagD (HAD superfamily)